MPSLRVVDPGFFTTVQDLGRPGFASIGVPASGAADSLSLIVGNRLLGNVDGAAAFECTLTGLSVEVDGDMWVCLTGATCPAARIVGTDGKRVLPSCTPTDVRTGDCITVGALADGARAYLCVSFGLDVPTVLGSRSTYVGISLGGQEGRALRRGDVFPLIERTNRPREAHNELDEWLREQLSRRTVRVVDSLHHDRFPCDARQRLASSEFAVGAQSNRTGIRLDGPAIPLPDEAGVLESEPTVTGGVQITGDGTPIVLGVDRPTTGGYALLACVIRSDLSALAMLRPRDRVRFERVPMHDARQLADEQHQALDRLLAPSDQASQP